MRSTEHCSDSQSGKAFRPFLSSPVVIPNDHDQTFVQYLRCLSSQPNSPPNPYAPRRSAALPYSYARTSPTPPPRRRPSSSTILGARHASGPRGRRCGAAGAAALRAGAQRTTGAACAAAAARMPDRVRGVAGAVLGDGEDGGADAAEVEMESARAAAAALAAGGLGEHTVVRRQRIVPTDVGSGDDGYSSGEEYEIMREGDFAVGSRGSDAASLTGPWAVAPRFQRQLGAMEEALLHRIETSAAAEKQMLGVARFALSAKLADSIRDRRVALLRSSVLPALVRTVQRYAHEPRTATVGCSVFSAISADDGEMQLALGAAGAVEAVVACVEKNLGADDSQPTEAGLCALTSLACTLSNRQNMREHGGIEVVIATMGQHSDSSAIQIEGCTLLANCAFGCDENKQLIADKFGIDLVRLVLC
jgi:hypothetical protein